MIQHIMLVILLVLLILNVGSYKQRVMYAKKSNEHIIESSIDIEHECTKFICKVNNTRELLKG